MSEPVSEANSLLGGKIQVTSVKLGDDSRLKLGAAGAAALV